MGIHRKLIIHSYAMKHVVPSGVLFALITLFSGVFAQGMPACATQCLESSLKTQNTCTPTDTSCICTTQTLMDSIEGCVLSSCTTIEALCKCLLEQVFKHKSNLPFQPQETLRRYCVVILHETFRTSFQLWAVFPEDSLLPRFLSALRWQALVLRSTIISQLLQWPLLLLC